MQYQTQGLSSFSLMNAYTKEEDTFMKIFQTVRVFKVSEDPNIIIGHVSYKIKANDDDFCRMKARIAPHGNKDSDTPNLKTDSSICPTVEIRIQLSMVVIFHWCLDKIDFKSACLRQELI